MESRIINTDFGRLKRTFFNINTGELGNSLADIYAGESFDKTALKYFVTIGYVPGDLTLFNNIVCLPGGAEIEIGKGIYFVKKRMLYSSLNKPTKYQGADKHELINEGISLLIKIIGSLIDKNKNKKIILPITAGLDSKAILLALLNFVPSKDIHTFTFGYEDCKDLVGVPKIVKKYRLNHATIKLDNIILTHENIISFGQDSDFNKNLIEQPAYKFITENYSSNDVAIYSGILGGSLSGSNKIDCDIDDPLDIFINFEKKGSGNAINPAYSVLGESITDMDRDKIRIMNATYDDYDMLYRHERLIVPHFIWNRCNTIAPFCDERWISFWLSLPDSYRIKSRWFLKEIIQNMEVNFNNTARSFLNNSWLSANKFYDRVFQKTSKWKPKQTILSNLEPHLFKIISDYNSSGIGINNLISRSHNSKLIELLISLFITHDYFQKRSSKSNI